MGVIAKTMPSADVCVIGGGTAGVIAAIQAARAGATTVLVEKTGMLGGTMTQAGIAFPGLFYAWQKPIAAGIGWELCCRAVEAAGSAMPDFSAVPKAHWMHQVKLNGPLLAMLCDEMALESGVTPWFHTMPAEIVRGGDVWTVRLCAKEGLRDLTCTVLVDATGDANGVSLAGFPVIRTAEDTVQPATYSCRLSGYDPARIDAAALTEAYRRAVAAGELRATDGGWSVEAPSPMPFVRGWGGNGNHIGGVNAGDSMGKTRADIDGRRSILRMYRFLRRQPGFERLSIDFLYPECGVRESVVIDAETMITLEDYECGRVFDDAIGAMYYPVDEHVMRGGGLTFRPLNHGVTPTIPRGALTPKGSKNLLVAGRTLGSDHMANSGLRVQCACMVMGQAAGAMAALAASMGMEVTALPMESIRALLAAHGAILPHRGESRNDGG